MAQGEKDDSPAGAIGFTYKIVYPENQLSKNGYFDLKMKPGQEQTVEVLLSNPGSEPITVSVSANSARTNPNGVIEYGSTSLQADKSMKFNFTDIVDVPKTLEIPVGKVVPLSIKLTMPETSFDGIVLGGIHMQRVTKDENPSEQRGTMVVNEYAYVLGLQLRESETEIPYELGFVKAYADQPDYKNTIVIDLGNKSSDIVKDVSVEAQIMGENDDNVLYEATRSNMRFAPNTVMNFPVSMEGQPMKPGKYRAHILAKSGSQKWEWTEGFTISKKDAEDFNKKAVGLIQEPGINWLLVGSIVGAGLILVVVLLLIVYLRNNKMKKEQEEFERKKKAKKKG
ncbi:DUF916 and DUF3324 domain-containing protein [Enterococcus wangshanyuanii]|uniref:DUF916 and DUF3324 domain-containing protein n=1 Tax=Enterococcus wangshanyuanii TaxID=2005703 RepID=UPI001E2E5638|nr:DUF916 and DUF3324 domain-containing protein [Enterococcus wangshanyuanii]